MIGSAPLILIGESRTTFLKPLEKRYPVLAVRSGKAAVDVARQQAISMIVLDSPSLGTNGERIVKMLRQKLPGTPIIHIHGAAQPSHHSLADVVLQTPFTIRKLTNAIGRLQKADVLSAQGDLLHCGPFSMSLEKRILFVSGQEYPLTPKQASLVEAFMRQPGEVIARKQLMQRVWQTDYVGDTRTLDVHIRLIRRAMESDPSRPRYLRTVRGVGYILDVSE